MPKGNSGLRVVYGTLVFVTLLMVIMLILLLMTLIGLSVGLGLHYQIVTIWVCTLSVADWVSLLRGVVRGGFSLLVTLLIKGC